MPRLLIPFLVALLSLFPAAEANTQTAPEKAPPAEVAKTTAPNKGVTGLLRHLQAPKAEGLRDRELVVWLPPGYEENVQASYPVLYMQDGQNLFDPATSAFGVDWGIDETLDALIRAGTCEPVIVVGIHNTPDRSDEYLPVEKGKAYRNYLAHTLKPFIDTTYRTKQGREHCMVGGSSAGGVLAFMMAWEYPELFSRALCFSPAFKLPDGKEGDWNYARTVEAAPHAPRGLRLYIDNGGVELEARLQPGVDEMLAALRRKGLVEGREFLFVKDAEARHSEAAWARRFPAALLWVVKK
jgi:enterochelin esterase-like enzyme